MTPPEKRPVAERRAAARALADDHGGVVSRRLLRSVGVDRAMVAREVRAERWQTHGNQTVAVHTADLGTSAQRWRSVWEAGISVAAIDGATALQHAGLTGFDEDTVHLSVRHTIDVQPVEGTTIHKVIRRVHDELLDAGIPRTRPAVAAIRAAHWATSNRQAALLLCMPVQQRLCTGAQLAEAQRAIPGRNRRAFVRTVVHDIADGAHSLGELDLVAACRARGLPEPGRQVLRRLPGGKAYLDLGWEEARLAVEVDGSGHASGLQMVDDDLRQNEVQLGDELVLRVNLVGWRLTPQAYLDQICHAYWTRLRRVA